MIKHTDPTVFLIDDDPLIGKAIAWLLDTIRLKARIFDNAQSFLESYDADTHGCILIDIRMRGMSGLELQQRLNKLNNQLPILMISGHADVTIAVQAMQAGAKDFILKPFNDQVLLDKIQAAIAEDLKRCSNVAKRTTNKCYQQLTARQREVMAYVVAGKMNKQIAAELAISISTVELHRARVMQKMQVKSLAELIKAALLLDDLPNIPKI